MNENDVKRDTIVDMNTKRINGKLLLPYVVPLVF